MCAVAADDHQVGVDLIGMGDDPQMYASDLDHGRYFDVELLSKRAGASGQFRLRSVDQYLLGFQRGAFEHCPQGLQRQGWQHMQQRQLPRAQRLRQHGGARLGLAGVRG